MNKIYINNKEFRKYNDTYYISSNGEVYSLYSKKIIKPLKNKARGKEYLYVDIYENGKQKHKKIHRLVYQTWIGALKEFEQVNHKDDNSLNNDYKNLYKGSQKENIKDCKENNRRVGCVYQLILFDKEKNKTISFCPANKFIEYSGHSSSNGSIKKFFDKKWFNNRYEIIKFKKIKNLNEYESVTTMGDECNPVE